MVYFQRQAYVGIVLMILSIKKPFPLGPRVKKLKNSNIPLMQLLGFGHYYSS